jgi:arsenate reductase
MKEVGVDDTFIKQDIKTSPLTTEQIEELYQSTQSYEALINKRARKLKDALIDNPVKVDEDYKAILLTDYTFLKRPVFQIDDQFFIGNAKKTIQELKDLLEL